MGLPEWLKPGAKIQYQGIDNLRNDLKYSFICEVRQKDEKLILEIEFKSDIKEHTYLDNYKSRIDYPIDNNTGYFDLFATTYDAIGQLNPVVWTWVHRIWKEIPFQNVRSATDNLKIIFSSKSTQPSDGMTLMDEAPKMSFFGNERECNLLINKDFDCNGFKFYYDKETGILLHVDGNGPRLHAIDTNIGLLRKKSIRPSEKSLIFDNNQKEIDIQKSDSKKDTDDTIINEAISLYNALEKAKKFMKAKRFEDAAVIYESLGLDGEAGAARDEDAKRKAPRLTNIHDSVINRSNL